MKVAGRLHLDAFLISRCWSRIRPASRRSVELGRVIVIAPPASGNIGDEAMVHAVGQRIGPRMRLVVTGETIRADHPDMDSVHLPDLVYPRRLSAFIRANRDLARLVEAGDAVAVLGADMMDGGYSPGAARRRWAIVGQAGRAGHDARVLGFSWNGRAPRSVKRAARRAAKHHAQLLARDPVSLRRLQRDSITTATAAADVVFSRAGMPGEMHTSELDRIAGVAAGASFAIVNASALVARKVDRHVEHYVRIIECLNARGLHCVLLPHVIRSSGNDLEECERIARAVGHAGLSIVKEQLDPETVRLLARRADVVVSGRMHLAVMALGELTPAVTIGTQGKVEGLMELIGRPSLCIAPSESLGDDVIHEVESVLAEPARIRTQLKLNIPDIRRLAERNFLGLGIADAATMEIQKVGD
ncbi:polysaccharide pyruvyl transferase family protein [Agromyces sp. Marseille-Q5079]|uniref:polysaccharide pyruvyl transferase family protein n=1 Tax=Agromyces sp. Marseille-Q5079 TaxID=3439059 RepID=UPI003D9CB7B7